MILGDEEDVDKQEDEKQKQPRIINFPSDGSEISSGSSGSADRGPRLDSGCVHNGQNYKFEEEFYDNCDQFCICAEEGAVFCNPIKCPSEFGLDVINPFCLEWEKHDDFVPKSPTCCPKVPKCLSDGSCQYEGQKFKNYDNIPANLTGCEKRCYCENGEVLCQDACYEISEEPPGKEIFTCLKETKMYI